MSGKVATAEPLEGRRALVTGSSRNLGAQIAWSLASRGCAVALTYRSSRPEAERLASDLRRETGSGHVAVQADLSGAAGVDPMVDRASDALGGPVDVLVNNHGPFSVTPLHRIPPEEFAAVLDGNLTVSQRAVARVVPGMRAGGWGRIVNLAAGSGYVRNHSVYGIAKVAVVALTESLALELGPEITVNAVAPGQIAESAPDVDAIDPTFVDRALRRTPAGRLVSRHEVAEVVAMLCTPPFDMLNGAVLPLDGGWRLNRF